MWAGLGARELCAEGRVGESVPREEGDFGGCVAESALAEMGIDRRAVGGEICDSVGWFELTDGQSFRFVIGSEIAEDLSYKRRQMRETAVYDSGLPPPNDKSHSE